MTEVRLTHIGGPTLLIEFDGWHLLSDPTFDAPGRRYSFGWGTASTKTAGPALAVDDLPPIDAVLLSHDHHADNLDDAGRSLLPMVGTVVTTQSGARRLGSGARGLRPWDTTVLKGEGRPSIEVTATPARHGPPLSRPLAGEDSLCRRRRRRRHQRGRVERAGGAVIQVGEEVLAPERGNEGEPLVVRGRHERVETVARIVGGKTPIG